MVRLEPRAPGPGQLMPPAEGLQSLTGQGAQSCVPAWLTLGAEPARPSLSLVFFFFSHIVTTPCGAGVAEVPCEQAQTMSSRGSRAV